ncbi:hypothetical protein CK203_034750 [Vitis vinifera]|uniref:Uncharacterized protein n=1 Tax=Vitis vinifera TaxID=29760 RepID=A0A438HWF9_VITVI|nr:hypothetical protein CK203_034750 [Vitis vinifera]
MDASLESKSLPSVGNSRNPTFKSPPKGSQRDKLVHLHGRRSLAFPSVGPGSTPKCSTVACPLELFMLDFSSLLSLLAFMICLWQRIIKLQSLEAIEGISLYLSTLKEIQFTTEAFKDIKRLRHLQVYRNGLSSYDANTVHLPEEFEFPSYELRYLHWDKWSLESLPLHFNGEGT